MRRLGILLLAAAALVFLFAMLLGGAQGAYTTAGGQGAISLDDIDAGTSEVTKVSSSPPTFEVADNLTIAAGDVLVIAAGTEVRFANDTRLEVIGGLQVLGTAASPVVLRTFLHPSDEDWEWLGVEASASTPFVLEHARFVESLGITYANGTGGSLRDVSYQGRLLLDNASRVGVESIVMTPHPRDTGRPPLWIVNADNITVEGADLTSGYGWGTLPSAYLLDSRDILIRGLTSRIDNFQLPALSLERSHDVRVENFTVLQGPNLGVPGSGINAVDSTDVWLEHVSLPEATPVGVIYGTNSNMTIANSTFSQNATVGVWAYSGKLVGLNATRMPARPEFGGSLWEFELVAVEARFASGGMVRNGSATINNDSWSASAPVSGGLTLWMWALRYVNDSGVESFSEQYRADVACNCTAGFADFTLVDAPGVVVTVVVGDVLPPVAVVVVTADQTGEQGVLDASGSVDNDAVADWAWTTGAPNVTGLPCTQAVCSVTFQAPGEFVVLLRLTDAEGNYLDTVLRLNITDATPPTVRIVGALPSRPGQGEPFTVTAEAQDNDLGFLPSVEWYLDGVPSPGASLTQSFQSAAIGNHTVRIVVSDDAGNAAEANLTLYVHDSTAPVIGAWTPPSGLHPGAQLVLNGSVATDNVGVVAWRWQVVGPGTDYSLSGVAPNATFPAAGSYSITLNATDAEGNQGNRAWTVEVLPAPAPGGFVPGFAAALVLTALAAAAGACVAWRRLLA
jgi:hypothetical protein